MSNYIKLAIGVNREGRAFFAQTDSDLIVQINVQHNGDLQTQLLEDNFISPGWKLTQYHDLGPQTTISSFRQSFDFNYLYEIRAMRKIVYLLFNKSLVNKLLQEWRNISWKEKILLTICTIVDATGIVADDMHAFVNNLKSKTKKNGKRYYHEAVASMVSIASANTGRGSLLVANSRFQLFSKIRDGNVKVTDVVDLWRYLIEAYNKTRVLFQPSPGVLGFLED
ncbi:3987_t:CDS:2 [Entrophospora sp. SA101]|nr:3987_t:CDS:2 [Entrophospora sp. SA101]